MQIYLNDNVLEAGLARIRMLFDEFPNVVVGYSGGKDSTVILNLALQVAEEKGRLPIPVLFIDQEAEWQGTIDLVKQVMYDPRVKPMWFQIPMVMTNNASSFERFNHCWNEADRHLWVHPQDPISIKENKYGVNRFHDLFAAIFDKEFENESACYLAGVRTEESPKRFTMLTDRATYKYHTWGKILNKKKDHYTFYPIYDWGYVDVWKAIHEHGWAYNRVYDEMYRHGATLNDMRISNVHHETSIQSLMLIQEIEPETWERIVPRIAGANTIKHIKSDSYRCPKKLPYMFNSWKEYALHLADNLIQDPKDRQALDRQINYLENLYNGPAVVDPMWKMIVKTVLSSDWDFTKIKNWEMMGDAATYRRLVLGKKLLRPMLRRMRFLTPEQQEFLINHFKAESEKNEASLTKTN